MNWLFLMIVDFDGLGFFLVFDFVDFSYMLKYLRLFYGWNLVCWDICLIQRDCC